MTTELGVQFPSVDGKRSTTTVSREVFSAAAATADASLAEDVAREKRWHVAYADHLRTLTAAAAASGAAGAAIARAGLDTLHQTFVMVDEDGIERPLDDAVAGTPARTFGTRTVAGTQVRTTELVMPYRGQQLRGQQIIDQANRWVRDGIVEPSFADAMTRVVEHPEWLDLTGRSFALLGAGAEMGPTELLLGWGADVHAVDIPVPAIWDRLASFATAGAGTLHVPTRPDGGDGCDLIAEPAAVRAWLGRVSDPLLIGNYAYADGADFVRVAMAADTVMVTLQRARSDISLAYLATPTDVFAVPAAAVAESRRRQAEGGLRMTAAALTRSLSGGKAFIPNYLQTITAEDGRELGIADCLVLQQGPNYALAKRLQRWRALVARQDGCFSSVHVAPATKTKSVTKNKMLAAAYRGAHVVGVEPFAPDTSRAVMAAMLVHDLMYERSSATPGTLEGSQAGTEVEHDLTDAAAHSGLWRIAWETRSALGLAVAAGAREFLP
jgi:hypothetical protein